MINAEAENVEEILPLPEDFTGRGQLFMLRVRGDSMIEAGIFDGDYIVVRQQGTAEPGETVVAGIPARVIKQVAELTGPPGWFERPYVWPPYSDG